MGSLFIMKKSTNEMKRYRGWIERWVAILSTRFKSSPKALREFMHGMTAHEMDLELRKERGNLDHLFMLVVLGDLVGLLCTGPIIPMSYSLGKKKTLEMLLSGDMIDAKEAERLGLVNKVVPAENLEEETFAFAKKLIDKSPIAIQMGKEFYYQMIDMPFRQRFALNREVMTRLCTTEDALEGINAFIEKRQPLWKGK